MGVNDVAGMKPGTAPPKAPPQKEETGPEPEAGSLLRARPSRQTGEKLKTEEGVQRRSFTQRRDAAILAGLTATGIRVL